MKCMDEKCKNCELGSDDNNYDIGSGNERMRHFCFLIHKNYVILKDDMNIILVSVKIKET
jgi:hypothetical protein